ncbi:uncharacterized protein LOC131683095 [Topomyia yanbarensis]|uniref:uncharacterized protein LOC131683095 n=1 Tax=Topomyia yanbarensis TaxID=2498891 RepID=UPI00273AFD04|nr:uncharacterized protein LOC131683095 [Topomyia yanbarensis]
MGALMGIFASTVLPVLAILFVGAIAVINLFLNIRKRFSVRVNCWFCNRSTKVPYDNSNSWVCPSCTQYNGFTEDGDYNREIPEQFQCRLNPTSNITDDDKISYSVPYNGLCFGCNRNQELKIHQLASFVPDVEENYDFEVEEYQRQLEQTYKLCSRCERVLKRTLNEVKRNILGSKLAQIGTKGLKVLDLHMAASDKQNAFQKRQTVASLCLWMIIVLLAVKIGQRVVQVELSRDRLEMVFSSTVTQTILIAVSYLLAIRHTLTTLWNGIWEQPAVVDGLNQLSTVKEFLVSGWQRHGIDISETVSDGDHELSKGMSDNGLLNLALLALAAMLLGAKSHVDCSKPIVLMLCCVGEMVFGTEYGLALLGKESSHVLVEVFLSFIALIAAIGCLGQTAPKIQPSDDLNTSFHKIYSQQATECDYSDASEHHQQSQTFANDASVKSMDTTKSISPSVLSASTVRPFLDCSFSVLSSPKSTFGGSVLSVNRLNTTIQEQPTRTFSRQSLLQPESSLLKTPSFSVDNFTTATTAAPVNRGFHKYGYSMNALNHSTFMEDRFGDDIDRLSISGRMSVSRKDLSMVNNPFATHHVDNDDSFSLRHRKVTISPPKLGAIAESGSSWIAGGYWGMSPQKNEPESSGTIGAFSQQPFMSRTSSQSSGFESQPTRRPTPEEPPTDLDRVSLFSEPAAIFHQSQQSNPRLNQSLTFPVSQHSPVPSFVPFASSSSRNLFGERSLFQQNPSVKMAMTQRQPFPPQQSQTPPVFGGGGLSTATQFQHLSSGFGPFLQSARKPAEVANGSHRRSLLNLSKLGELPEENCSAPDK